MDSQRGHSPVRTGSLSSRGENRQPDQRDGGRDGERADVLQQQARQAAEPDQNLDAAGDDDGALDLKDGHRDVGFLPHKLAKMALTSLMRGRQT